MQYVLIEQNKQSTTAPGDREIHTPETLQLQQLERVIYTAQKKKHDLDTVISENKLKVIIWSVAWIFFVIN